MFAKFELELETFRNDLSVWPSFNRNWHTQQGETIGLRPGNGDGDGNVVSCSNSNTTTTPTASATSLWFIMVYLDPHNQLTCARSQLTSCTSSSSSSWTLWSSSTTVSISQFPAPFPWLATLCEIGPERQREYPIPSAWVPLNGIELLKWLSESRWLVEFTNFQRFGIWTESL